MQQFLPWKINNVTYSKWVFAALAIQMQCACVILPSEACPALQYFSRYLIYRMIFEKKLFNIKCVLISCTTSLWNFSHSKRNLASYDKKCTLVFMQSNRYSCQILVRPEFSRQIFKKYSNIKFHENPFSGSRVVPCGRTDRHDEVVSRFSQLCERT
jgi:hypothetical protein